jgi:hypothetical protein
MPITAYLAFYCFKFPATLIVLFTSFILFFIIFKIVPTTIFL